MMRSNREELRLGGRDAPALGAPEELYLRARRALRRADRDSARESLETLGRSLETHFALEDRVYFPAVAALRPALGPTLRRLGMEHEHLLAGVADLLARVSDAETEVLVEALEELIADFERHEGDEEAILSSLEAKTDPP